MKNEIQAIDVHAHLGDYDYGDALSRRFMTGDAGRVVHLATQARTEWTVVSSMKAFFPEGGYDVVAGNEETLRAVEGSERLRCWAVLDPKDARNFAQVEGMLGHPRCAGIKVHPELHTYYIADYGQVIFSFAAKHGALVQSHSGQERSLPMDFVRFADAFPEVSLIVSHLGFGWDGEMTHQVRAIKASRHGNIHSDTSSSKSITPCLLEWAVGEVGAEKILYGTDSPLYFAPMQRARIDHADLSDEKKRLILRGNAERLLGLCS
jgi:hypothetical protein